MIYSPCWYSPIMVFSLWTITILQDEHCSALLQLLLWYMNWDTRGAPGHSNTSLSLEKLFMEKPVNGPNCT